MLWGYSSLASINICSSWAPACAILSLERVLESDTKVFYFSKVALIAERKLGCLHVTPLQFVLLLQCRGDGKMLTVDYCLLNFNLLFPSSVVVSVTSDMFWLVKAKELSTNGAIFLKCKTTNEKVIFKSNGKKAGEGWQMCVQFCSIVSVFGLMLFMYLFSKVKTDTWEIGYGSSWWDWSRWLVFQHKETMDTTFLAH